MKYEERDMEYAGGDKFLSSPVVCSKDGLYPFSYLQDGTVLKTPEEACHPQTQDQASENSMPDSL